MREQLLALAPGERLEFLLGFVRAQIAEVLHMDPARVRDDTPLPTLGLDSLGALELRNRLEVRLEVSLSVTLVFTYPTIDTLGPHLAEQMGISLEPEEAAEEEVSEAPSDSPAEELGLSEDEGQELAAMLSALQDLSDEDLTSALAESPDKA